MIGILNVFFNNPQNEVTQYFAALQREIDRDGFDCRSYILDNSTEHTNYDLPPSAHYERSPTNIGYTIGANRLMARAFADGCDMVITMNVDGFPLPGCLSALLAFRERVGARNLIEARQFPDEHAKYYERATGSTDWVTGCCLLIGREVYEELGAFDEHMFLYCEDVDYSFRARVAGMKCYVAEAALYNHQKRNRKVTPGVRKMHLMSARYLAAKWGNTEHLIINQDALVAEKHVTSVDELPEIDPETIRQHAGLISFDPANRLVYAVRRWIF